MAISERETARRWALLARVERQERQRLGELAKARRLISWELAADMVADRTSLLLRRRLIFSFAANGHLKSERHANQQVVEDWVQACGRLGENEITESALELRDWCDGCLGDVPELCECRDRGRNCFLVRFTDNSQLVMAKLWSPDAFRSVLEPDND